MKLESSHKIHNMLRTCAKAEDLNDDFIVNFSIFFSHGLNYPVVRSSITGVTIGQQN